MKTLSALALLCAISTGANAQEIIWGDYMSGAHPVSGEYVRFFAFSYVGSIGDFQTVQNQTFRMINHLDSTNQTHVLKDGDGNYFDLRLGQDKVFVIGWNNPVTRQYAFMATVPGVRPGESLIVTSDRGTLINTGWNRQRWLVNGYDVYLQLGCYDGKVQWQLGR